MSYDELYNMTPRAFWNAVDGFWLHYENETRKDWEIARWQTTLLLNIHLPKGKQIKMKKLATFPWEKNDPKNQKSYKETEQAYKKFLKMKKTK
tara:strand:- start:377 stop:655 length:279 start_codon:yes stop_codon:yes gene_type:complete